MPFVHIRIAGKALNQNDLARLQTETTRLMAEILRKKAALTAVLVEETPVNGWTVGGAAVAVAAHLEAKITEGTNDPEEKARFIAEATALLKEMCGETLPVATYVVLHEIPAESWGYDGLTQSARR